MNEPIKTQSDVGCIKVFNDSLACYFSNEYGDGENEVRIVEHRSKDAKFINSFDVRTTAWLSDYDSGYTPVYEFNKGRWFVYLVEPCIFEIVKIDERV